MDVLGTFLVVFFKEDVSPIEKMGDFPMSCWFCGGRISLHLPSNRGCSTGSLELHHAALHIPASNAPRCALSWGTNLARDPLEVRHRWLLQELTCWMGEILRFFFCVLHEVEYLFTYHVYTLKILQLYVCKHIARNKLPRHGCQAVILGTFQQAEDVLPSASSNSPGASRLFPMVVPGNYC